MKQVCMQELQVVRTEYHHVPVSKLVQNEYFDAVYCCKYLQNGFVIVGECRKVVPADGMHERYANACETLAEHNAHEQIMLIAAFLKKTGFGFGDPKGNHPDMDEYLYHVLNKLQDFGFKFDYYAELTIGGWSNPLNCWKIFEYSKDNIQKFRLSAQPIPKFKGWRNIVSLMMEQGFKFEYFCCDNNDWVDVSWEYPEDSRKNYRIPQQPITIKLAKIWPELKKIGDKNVQ